MNDTHLPVHVQRRLRACEEQLRAVFEDTPVAMALVADGRWLGVNARLGEVLGVDAAALIGMPYEASVPADDQPMVAATLRDLCEGRQSHALFDLRLLRGDKSEARFEVHATAHRTPGERSMVSWVLNSDISLAFSPVRDHEGRLIGASMVGRNFTGPISSAPQLRSADNLLETIFFDAQAMLAYLDRNFNYVKVNRAYPGTAERAPESLVGKNHFALYPDAENEAIFRHAVETGERYVATGRPIVSSEHPEWGGRYLNWTVQPVRGEGGRVEGLVLSAVDVTGEVQAKKRAEDAASYARLLFEWSVDPQVALTADGVIADANAAFLTMTGRTRDQVVGTCYTGYVNPVETAQVGFEKVIAGGEVRDVPLEIKHVDGHTTPVLYNATIYRDETGGVAGVLVVGRDIPTLRRAEEEVQRLNRWNKLVLDSVGEGVYGIDNEGRCSFANPAMARLLGYDTPEELLGKNAHRLFHHSRPDGRPYPAEECPVHGTSQRGEAIRGTDEFYWRKDGSGTPVEYVSTPIREGGKVVGAVATIIDITERQHAEGLLRRRAQEQEGIARLGVHALTGEGLDDLMGDATRLVGGCLEVELCNVLELLPGGKEVLLRAGVGWNEGIVGRAKLSAGPDSQAGFALESGAPVVVKELQRETRFSGPPQLHEHGVVSGLSVVIPGREGPFGVMGAYTKRQREFSNEDVNFLQAVANVIAASVERVRTEQALRKSEARLNKAQEIAHLGSWELDLASGVLFWSDEAYRIFGIDKGKFGASYEAFLDIVHPDDRSTVDFVYTNSLKTRAPYAIDHRLRMPDGRIKLVHEQCETVYAEDGTPLRSIGTTQDITERKRSEEALRQSEFRYRSLFERMFDGYAVHEIVLDADGHPTDYVFLEVNPAFERITGLRREQLLGRRVRDVLPSTEVFWIETYGQVALTGQGRRFQQYAREFDRYFEVAVFRPAPGQFATLFSDVTERRRAEEALRRLNRELEQRVKERTSALEAANRELESFAYSVSHDLRTPLRAIDGMSRILLLEQEARLDEDGRRLLRIVRENTEKMSQLIDDILNLSRTGRAEMREEAVSVTKLVQDVWAGVIQEQPGRRFELRLGDLPDTRGDRALLRQVFVNLLDNAAKFTRSRPEAIVEVGATPAPGETVYFVKDNGVGFDMTYVDKLFNAFQRLHSAEEFEGTGIGLAIVKRIVTRHKGRVWAESALDKGATFYFTLPRGE